MKMKLIKLHYLLLHLLTLNICMAQVEGDSIKKIPQHKNVIRYNLSTALLFGFDRYIVFGYERVIKPYQSISVNVGRASLPKLISIITDSFEVQRDKKSSGFNVSVDYRFYLAKENKFLAPRGVYIGPYYSYNHFTRDNEWLYKTGAANSFVNTHTIFNIHTVGVELGYQFILWKRFALDLVLVGPGLGFYNYRATFDSNVDAATKEQLFDGLEQLLKQKFPGMNFVFADKEINANGVLRANSIGYRYMIHIGYNF
jgi:hypothetical protein